MTPQENGFEDAMKALDALIDQSRPLPPRIRMDFDPLRKTWSVDIVSLSGEQAKGIAHDLPNAIVRAVALWGKP